MSNNSTIAKNTLYLYGRMIISLLVSLYTSRIVLNALGESDYGVYSVVGGVVGMFTFLNSSMAGATSRFLSFELGQNKDAVKLKTIFNSAMVAHIFIATIVVIISETFGIWFLNCKMNISQESMYAANIVLQLSVLTAVISMTQVPYTAAIMSHEKMSIFAFFDIAGTFIRLGAVLLLVFLPGNKLIMYSIMMFVIGSGIALIYRTYCIRNFIYCRLSRKNIEFQAIKPMLIFSGWDIYGNMSTMARSQGINMLINIFFGTIANAAVGIAGQVQGAIGGFASNVTVALKPQIIKSYASGNYSYMSQLLIRGAKFSFLVILCLALPVLIETDFILAIWLKNVPDYTVGICRWTIIFLFFSNMSYVLVTGVHATGNIKGPSLLNGTLYLSVVPITYFAYKYGHIVYVPFVLNALFVFLGAIANFIYTRRHVRCLSIRLFLSQVILKCFSVALLSAIIPLCLSCIMPPGWLRFIAVTLCSLVTTSILSLYIGMTNNERKTVLDAIGRFCNKLRKTS